MAVSPILRIPLIAILLSSQVMGAAGCASIARAGPTARDAPDEVELRVRVEGQRSVYAREQTITVLDDGEGGSLRVETASRLEHRRFGGDQILEHASYEALTFLRDGEPQPDQAGMRGIEHLVVRTLLDAHGQTVEDPQPTGRPATSRDLQSAIVAVVRLLRVSYPERPLAVGDSWQVEPIQWDTPPGHRLGLVVEPTWTLRGFDRDTEDALIALVDWDAAFRVLPFAAIAGTTLEGTGSIQGTSRVRVSDGVTGRTELDIEVSVGPSGATALIGLFRFDAKYTDVVTPAEEGVRRLVSPVVPTSSRPSQ